MQYRVGSHALITKRERKDILTNENSICYSEKSGTFFFFFLSIQVRYLDTHMSSPFFYSSPYIHTYLNKQQHHAHSALTEAHHINLCALPLSLDHSKVQLRKIYPVIALISRNQMVSNRRR